jgi:prophage regulatory protein
MTTSKNQKIENNRLIRRKEVQEKTGLGASSIYAMMKTGDFPQCLNLSERRVAWIESDIDKWIAERVANHRATSAILEA